MVNALTATNCESCQTSGSGCVERGVASGLLTCLLSPVNSGWPAFLLLLSCSFASIRGCSKWQLRLAVFLHRT